MLFNVVIVFDRNEQYHSKVLYMPKGILPVLLLLLYLFSLCTQKKNNSKQPKVSGVEENFKGIF